MKRFPKILIGVVLGSVLLVGTFMLLIGFQWRRSQHQVEQIVSRLTPGIPFSTVVEQLGSPIQSHTNADIIELYGTRKDLSFITNSTLYMYAHRGPPFRWILIYTDKDSRHVIYADWRNM